MGNIANVVTCRIFFCPRDQWFTALHTDYVGTQLRKRQSETTQPTEQICNELHISLNEVAYIGDDINDFELLSNVGLSACPSNSIKEIKNIAGIIKLEKQGGDGAVREFMEYIPENKTTV